MSPDTIIRNQERRINYLSAKHPVQERNLGSGRLSFCPLPDILEDPFLAVLTVGSMPFVSQFKAVKETCSQTVSSFVYQNVRKIDYSKTKTLEKKETPK